MAVLSILILASFTFFSSIQSTWSVTNSKQESFENARIALELISKDLETAYFGGDTPTTGIAPFWNWKPASTLPNAYIRYQNGHLAFIGKTSAPPNDNCTSPYCEIKYQLYYTTGHDDNEGWIIRSVTGDKTDSGADVFKWNWLNNFNVSYTCDSITEANRYTTPSYTLNSQSSGYYQKLTPYVLDLSFICDTNIDYDPLDSTSFIPPDTRTDTNGNPWPIPYGNPWSNSTTTKFPSVVTISMTLMDKSSWDKWVSLCGANVYHAPLYEGTSNDTARIFREGHQMTFTRMVYLGDRGQE